METEAFFDSVETGDLAAVRAALERDPALVHRREEFGDQPLHIAAWQQHADVVELLLRAGADANARGDKDRTPLHYAVHEGGQDSTPIVRLLLRHGADRRLRDMGGNTPLRWAILQFDFSLRDAIVMLIRGG